MTRLTMLAFIFLVVSSLAACAFVAEVYMSEVIDKSAKAHHSQSHRPNHYEPIISFAAKA